MRATTTVTATESGARLRVSGEGVEIAADLGADELNALRLQIEEVLQARPTSTSDADRVGDSETRPVPGPPVRRHDVLVTASDRLVYSSDDPRPAAVIRSGLHGPLDVLEFSRSAADFMELKGVSMRDVELGFADGGDEWISPRQAGESTVYIRVVDDDWAAAFFYPEKTGDMPYVVSVMPLARAYDERRRAGAPQAGRRGPGSPARTRAKPTTGRELHRLLRENGFALAYTGGDHVRVTHPEEPGQAVVVSNTPSDSRSIANELSRIRRHFPNHLD